MDNKAIVKKTGEIVDIKDQFSLRYVSFSIDFENVETIKLPESESTYTHGESSGKVGTYYLTIDGRKFHEDDVVVGLDEIREYKLKNNLEI
jgi:hypothetical protein